MAHTPNTASTDPKTTGSFAERVNYDAIYASLDQRGIALTTAEKTKLREICTDALTENDGQVFSSLFGGGGGNLLYMIFAFVQNLFNNSAGLSLSNVGTHIGQTATRTSELNQLHQLDTASQKIFLKLKAAGGNLATAASLISGATLASDPTPFEKAASESVLYSGLRKGIALTPDTTSSLNPGAHYAEATPPLPTPRTTDTRVLTAAR